MNIPDAIAIIERDIKKVKNPRILEQILDILGYGNKVEQPLIKGGTQ